MSENKVRPIDSTAKLGQGAGIVWVLYAMSMQFNTTVTMSYLMFFVTEYTGINATIMTAVITTARFVDFGVSIAAGPILNRVTRFTPWVIGCPLITGLGVCITFTNFALPQTPKLIILVIGYCMTHFPMNFLTVSANGFMMKVAGSNPENRLFIATRRNQGTSVSGVFMSLLTLPTIEFFMARGMQGYQITVFLFWIVCVAGAAMLLYLFRDYEPKVAKVNLPVAERPKQVSVFRMFGSAIQNKAIMTLLICETIVTVGGQVLQSGTTYFYTYSCGNLGWMVQAGTIGSMVGIAASLLVPPVARKIGKRNSRLTLYVMGLVLYGAAMFTVNGNAVLFIVLSSVLRLGTALSGTWGINLYLDAAEVELYETGEDKRPFIMAINNFPIKIGFIASGPFIAFMLNNSGYSVVEGVGSMPDPAQYVRWWMGVPTFAYLLAVIIFILGYKVSEEKAAEAAAANAKAAKERAAAAATG